MESVKNFSHPSSLIYSIINLDKIVAITGSPRSWSWQERERFLRRLLFVAVHPRIGQYHQIEYCWAFKSYGNCEDERCQRHERLEHEFKRVGVRQSSSCGWTLSQFDVHRSHHEQTFLQVNILNYYFCYTSNFGWKALFVWEIHWVEVAL